MQPFVVVTNLENFVPYLLEKGELKETQDWIIVDPKYVHIDDVKERRVIVEDSGGRPALDFYLASFAEEVTYVFLDLSAKQRAKQKLPIQVIRESAGSIKTYRVRLV